jgi:hypothetical protein
MNLVLGVRRTLAVYSYEEFKPGLIPFTEEIIPKL